MAIQLAETGARIDEIAAAVGKTRAHVSNVLRQPWARQRMIEEIKQEAQEDFKRLLEAERVRNLQVLTDIRDDPDATKRDKIAAIGMIWDRDMGRPNQPLTTATQITAEQLKNMNDGDILKALVSNGLIDPATVGKNASATADNPPKPANVV